MFLIQCPVTGTDELVSDSAILAVTNHPTHIAMTVRCPQGHEHVYRTGSRWERAHRPAPAREARELVGA
jgi:hypothetical protein